MMKTQHRKNFPTQLVIIAVGALVLTIVASIALVSFTYHRLVLGGQWALTSEWLHQADAHARSAALGQLGDYFGGTLNPILSFSGFLVLLLTVVLQRRQLQEGTRQLEQSTRAIDLEAFVRVNDILQTAEGIAARERLYHIGRDGPEHAPFTQWSAADMRMAEAVGRQFELVGVLVAGRLFDPNLFLRGWHHTVQRCWLACEELVDARRLQHGDPGFWRHFEELGALARLCQPTVTARLGYEAVTVPDQAQAPGAAQDMVRLSAKVL